MISLRFHQQTAAKVIVLPDLIFIVFAFFITVNETALGSPPKEKSDRHPDINEISVSLENDIIKEYLSDWELKKTSEDIAIYYQWIIVDSNKKIRRLLGDMVVNAPVSRVVALIMDETEAINWIFGLERFYNIHTTEENHWFSYIEFRFPWPLPNYDLILKNKLLHDLQQQVITIESQSVTDVVPEKAGIKRFSHFHGTWKLVSLPDGKTNVKFIILTGMNTKVPVWITDPIVMKGLIQSMKSMREMVPHFSSEFDGLQSISEHSDNMPEDTYGIK